MPAECVTFPQFPLRDLRLRVSTSSGRGYHTRYNKVHRTNPDGTITTHFHALYYSVDTDEYRGWYCSLSDCGDLREDDDN